MPKSSQPVFLLGLGAQKAGTTWLYKYISQFCKIDPGTLKEYHIWDALTVPELAESFLLDSNPGFRRNLRDLKNRILSRKRESFFLRSEMQRDPEKYFDYFTGILSQDGIHLTADITPSYSALQTETLVRVRDGFARRGITTKVIFLMRDPVERCLSTIRMHRRKGQSKTGIDITLSDEEALQAYITTPYAKLRTNYHNTLRSMDDVFAPEDRYVGVYETMFNTNEIDRLSAFLDVDANYSFVEKHFNVTQKTIEPDYRIIRDVAKVFGPVYDYCFKRYPELKMYWYDLDTFGEATQ